MVRGQGLSWVCSGCASVPHFPSRTLRREDTKGLFGLPWGHCEQLLRPAFPREHATLLPAGAPSSLPGGGRMLGWIERVVPQPPVLQLTEKIPPAPLRDPEQAKVSRKPVWEVLGALRAWWRGAQCLCTQPWPCSTQGCLAAPREGWGPGCIPPVSCWEALGFAATSEWGTCPLHLVP